jgi:hypothetical protein
LTSAADIRQPIVGNGINLLSLHSLCAKVELAVENDFKQHLAIQCGSEREIKNRKLYKVCLAYNLSHRFLCSDDGFK